MCGIFGYNFIDPDLVDLFFEEMKHRGPDAQRILPINNWTLGHLRLSIIDTTSSANQPFTKDGATIVFNGEIYNYLELKDTLLKGIVLKTTSDTEILLELLNRYGMKILNKLNGMFSFAWYQHHTGKLVLARDRFGVKPLNWFKRNNEFYFASEIKPLLKLRKSIQYNLTAIDCFMKDLASDFNEQTFVKEIFQIPAGHYMILESDGDSELEKWYNGSDYDWDKKIFANNQETIDFFENIMTDAVRIRCRSDVPICLTLSGGLDSTVIYTLMREHVQATVTPFTFTHPFSRTDESALVFRLAREYGDDSKIVTVKDDGQQGINDYLEALKIMEFPIWSPSAVGYLNMYKEIKRHGFKVVIEGHGSDEQLGGYPVMVKTAARETLLKGKIKFALELYKIAGQTSNPNLDQVTKVSSAHAIFSEILTILRIIKENIFSNSRVNYLKLQSVLDDSFYYRIMPLVLRAFDRLSMSQSVESRSPFMDYRVVEFLRALPLPYKVNTIGSKAILREILKKYHKNYIYQNKIKTGYASDLKKMFRDQNFRNKFIESVDNFPFVGYKLEQQRATTALKQQEVLWTEIETISKVASLAMLSDIYQDSYANK